MHRFSITVDENTALAVKNRAAQDGRSLAEVVRRSLVSYLAEAESRWVIVTDIHGCAWAEKWDGYRVFRVRLDLDNFGDVLERPVESLELVEQ
jgi:hypothetical protein